MKTTKKITADGEETEVQWWEKEDFTSRVCIVSDLSGISVDVTPIPDNTILCDFCNVQIEEFPIPVIAGYALCPSCYIKI